MFPSFPYLTLKGEVHTKLEYEIAANLMDSISSGLEAYKHQKGNYPVIHTRYFLDSLENISFIKHPYLYNNECGKYIAIGDSTQFIEYQSNNGVEFNLFFNRKMERKDIQLELD